GSALAAAADDRHRRAVQGSAHEAKLARGYFRRARARIEWREGRSRMTANWRGVRAIYAFEMARFGRTFWTSLMLPVITTALYFVVFGSAIGSRMTEVSDVPYGAFIVPGLMMLTMFTESISNASFGIYMPKW